MHNALGINFEVKTVKKINLQKVWKQSERDAGMAHTIPMLAIHFDGMAENEWLMTLHSEDWADLFLRAKEPKTIQGELSRTERYKVERLIQSAKEVLKLYE